MTCKSGKLVGLNVTVDCSPKDHPESTGECIEYNWANVKYYLRTVPIVKRKIVQQFMGQVRLALATSKGAHLSYKKIQHFSVRAQDCIGADHHLENVASPAKQLSFKITTLFMKDNEKMKKIYHLHQSVER
eukprot:13915036-Ditylum_brightwellii.AAC.1